MEEGLQQGDFLLLPFTCFWGLLRSVYNLKWFREKFRAPPPLRPTDGTPAEDYGGHAGHGRILNQPPNLHAHPDEIL